MTNEAIEVLETKKKDILLIDWHNLDIEEGFNIREDYGDLNELADSIFQHGILVPLTIRANRETPGRYYVVQGHRRYFAVELLIKTDKVQNLRMPGVPEKKGTTELDRLIDMIVANEGKSLNVLEFAGVIKRFKNHGLTSAEIAKKLSKSVGHINNSLRLLELPEEIKKAIKDNVLSHSLVMQIMRECKDPAEAVKVLHEAIDGAVVVPGTGKISKITKKTLDKKKGKYNSVSIMKKFSTKQKHLKVKPEEKETFKLIMDIIEGKVSEEKLFNMFYEEDAPEL